MQGIPKRKGSDPKEVDLAKRARWREELTPPPPDSTPTPSGSALISGVHTAQIHGGTFAIAGPGSVNTTIHHHYYGPPPLPSGIMEILRSLPLPNFRDIQLDTYAKATEGTCLWMTRGETYFFWLEKGKILWGVGIPGAGKTVLASIVIHDLLQQEEASGGAIHVAFVYLRYSEPLSLKDVLESFVKQLVEHHPNLASLASGLYMKHKRDQTKPSQQELMRLLTEFIKCGKSWFFLLDALDELRAEDRPTLLSFMASLDVKLFITSRPLEALQRQYPGAQVFNIAASPLDLDLHIKLILRQSPDLAMLLEGSDLEDRIIESVLRKSGGMFLYANLQLEALRYCTSAQDIEDTLEEFPTEIGAIYTKTWERILAQPPRHANLAKLVFLWILYADGEITIDLLQRLVSTSPETHIYEAKRLVPETLIVAVCCGLVTVDSKTKLARLFHYTTQDTIRPYIQNLYPNPHSIPTRVCIAHLTNQGFQSVRDEFVLDDAVEDPILAYAYASWAHHGLQCVHDEHIMSVVAAFIQGCTRYPDSEDSQSTQDFFGPLHVAIAYGFDGLVPLLATPQSINSLTERNKSSPLALACQYGQHACAKDLLLVPGIDVNQADSSGKTPLMHASQLGYTDVVEPLLGAQGIDINAVDKSGMTAFMYACGWGAPESVKLLLAVPGLSVNVVDKKRTNALIHACRWGRIENIQLLVEVNGLDVNARDMLGWTGFMYACERDRMEIMELLVNVPGFNVNMGDRLGDTALSHACRSQAAKVVEFLLKIPNINVNAPDKYRRTPLMYASYYGYADIVRLLLGAPTIDVNARAVHPEWGAGSALSFASQQGHSDVVELLSTFQGAVTV